MPQTIHKYDIVLLQARRQCATVCLAAFSSTASAAAAPALLSRAAQQRLPSLTSSPSVEGLFDVPAGEVGSQLAGVASQVGATAGTAWHALMQPLAIFGEDCWPLNIMFIATLGLLSYTLLTQRPQQ